MTHFQARGDAYRSGALFKLANLLTELRMLAVPRRWSLASDLPGLRAVVSALPIFSPSRRDRLVRRLSGARLVSRFAVRPLPRPDRRQAAGGAALVMLVDIRPRAADRCRA